MNRFVPRAARLCLAAFWLAGAAPAPAPSSPAPSPPPAPPPVVASQDGILASLRTGPAGVMLQWRFLHAPPAPITAITADLGGTVLQPVAVQGYPLPGDRTDILFLFDLTDRYREDEIQRNKVLALLLMSRMKAYQDLGLAYYGARSWLLAPAADRGQRMLDDLLSLAPLDQTPDRDAALLDAIVALGTQHAARRAVYVFSDGHDGAPPRSRAVIGAALHYGVSVSFVTANAGGHRKVDAAALRAIAAATGGQVITRKDLPAFLAHPFRLLDSGGEVLFSAASAAAPPGTLVRVRISYGNRVMEFGGPAPPATPPLRQRLMQWLARARSFLVQHPGVPLVVVASLLLLMFRGRLTRSRLGRWLGARMSFGTTEETGPAVPDAAQTPPPGDRPSVPPPPAGAAPKAAPKPPEERQVSLDELWDEMTRRLRRHPAMRKKDLAPLTLSELAARLPRGDEGESFRRLVREWYYPRRFARTEGGMPDDEARRIMASLFRGQGGE